MTALDLMKRPAAYACGYENAPAEAQRYTLPYDPSHHGGG